jgi:perosamine synthetase
LGTFGDAGCFSFSANKTITTGQGGMIATNNTRLYYRLLELKDQGRRAQGTGGDDLHPVMGYNFKFTDLQAAVGLAQLEKLTARLKKSKQRDSWYKEFLAGCPSISLPSLYSKEGEVTQWTDVLIEDRNRIIVALNRGKIGYRCFWHPIHRQQPYRQSDAAFGGCISVSKRGLWLPSYFGLTKEEVKYTAKIILKTLCQK